MPEVRQPRFAKLMKLFKGFTLIELLVVIAIIGILASLAITSFRVVLLKAEDSRNKSLAGTVGSAISQYGVDHGNSFPVTAGGDQVDLSTLSSDLTGYLKTDAALTQATGVAKYTSGFNGTSFAAGWELKYSNDPTVTSGNGVYQTDSADSPGSVTAGISVTSDGLYFDGTRSTEEFPFINIPHINAYNSNFTFTLWVKPERFAEPPPPVGYGYGKTPIIGKTNYLNSGWLVSINDTGLLDSEMIGGTIGWEPQIVDPPILTLDTCNMIAVTWDGSDLTTMNLSTNKQRVSNYISVPTNSNPIVIGTKSFGFDYFKGTVDDFRIYNRVLTAAELETLYSSGKGTFGGSAEMGGSLTGGWRMNDGGIVSPQSVSDYSTNSNDGTTSGVVNQWYSGHPQWRTGCVPIGLSGLGSSLTGRAFMIYGPQ